MAVPFGFSVGDFIAVGKLIAQIVDELREVCPRVHVALLAVRSFVMTLY